jgi:para-aminobenzoate synthetase/4-amino-4-deoxychorismate lyase
MIARSLIRKPDTGEWLQLSAPVATLVADHLKDVLPVLTEVESRVEKEALTAVGFICYEAAAAFDSALQTHPPGKLPPVTFALFDSVDILSDSQLPWLAADNPADWQLDVSQDEYLQNIAAIRTQIGQGNVYQINYTMPLTARGIESWPLFSQIARDAEYAALIEADEFAIVSASPELFFKLDGSTLRCEPMKGTASRGLSSEADLAQAQWLTDSQKNQAENLMITDMVRNDVGRIATPGSVATRDLFKVAQHPTVWQMTSTVSCETQASITEILTHLFPGASITGAPKNASMSLIRSLEPNPREVYTGTIGLLEPGRKAQFNIAIRTAWIDKRSETARYHAGGGIVWDSEANAEFAELLAKTKILQRTAETTSFELLETLLWQPRQGYYLLTEHLQRLEASARYWGFHCDQAAIRDQLMEYSRTLASDPMRIRLLVDCRGTAKIEHAPLPAAASEPVQLTIYPEAIDPEDPLLYHKTTARGIYDRALSWAAAGTEALLQNPDGFVTESPIANLVYQLDGNRYTPPVSCGLLPGTLRRHLLDSGEICERPLPAHELPNCDALWLINSLRGWREARFTGENAD